MLRSLAALTSILVLTVPGIALAAVTASPLIIDETVEPRDSFEQTITLRNDTAVPVRLFASVNEITLDEGGAIKTFVPASVSDGSVSITSWIAIDRRRIELPPGASTTIPVSVRLNPNAQPGLYHAFIGFGSGTNRDEAEAKVMGGSAVGVIMRINISDTRTELLRLARFTVDRLVTRQDDSSITYAVTNPGDLPLTPEGEVILYNARGEEVAAVPLNTEKRMVAPGETVNFSAPITPKGMFGKYKAFLSLEYGAGQKASVHDTAFFYAAPIPYLIGLFGAIFVLCLSVVFWWRRSLVPYGDDDSHDGHVALYVRPGAVRNDHEHDITLTKPPAN